MYEVEVKVAADHDDVRRRLPDDAAFVGTVEQVDTYFDAPHRDFAETDEALRLRRERDVEAADRGDEGWSAAVAYKGPLLEAASKTREEFETGVDDPEALAAALERLGFSPAAEVRKERERYRIGEFTVSLDSVEGLGEYVEVESEQADDDVAPAREEARSILADLGCDPDEQIRTSYLGLSLGEEE